MTGGAGFEWFLRDGRRENADAEQARRHARHRPAAGVARHRSAAEAARRAMECSPDAFVVVDDDGLVIEWNAGAERLFGWTRDEMADQRLTLVTPLASTDEVQPFGELTGREGTADARRVTMPVVDRAGNTRMVQLTVWPIEWDAGAAHAGIFRVLGEQAAQQAVCCGGAIVESTDAAITSENLGGCILSWNAGAESTFGYTSEEMVGRHASVLTPPERVAETARLYDDARQGRSVSNFETVRVRKDGSRVDVALTVSPIHDVHHDVVGVSTVARDISEQVRMNAALEAAFQDAREAEARSRRFLADAAHQLRNPMAGVRACADSLLRTSSPAGRERLLARLIDDMARAARLVDRLLRVARLDQGETPDPRPTDLVALCRREAERARIQSPELEVTVTGAVGESFCVDADVVAEILSNLLDNACRYACGRIEVALSCTPESIEIAVSDDGPGLAPDKAEVAFERFATLDHRGGSGLGLPIARGLARAHGGDLTYGAGGFRLRLPA